MTRLRSLHRAPPARHNAALAWLSRRHPRKWREPQQVDIAGSIEHRLAQMTPEERYRDAMELAARVKARLAELHRTIDHEPKE
jgi:hypothetical protein